MMPTNEINFDNKDTDTYGGLGLAMDVLVYDLDLWVMDLSFGLSSNILYSNFHFVRDEFSSNFGAEKVNLLNLSLNPGVYISPFSWLILHAAALINYSYISYGLDDDGFKQTLKGGFHLAQLSGLCFS